ncbi:hypothetical protein BD289DRAFT_421862 [Coniella lustricola]|uniref:Uncharacterized protein n=1 Tax=Coniella lustricola TaxID=2025994 RepID=A0A2T3AL29_9PEZI|nr:hypothetical protein BD289DRAFT_421862 [Coniella lustricola]
MLDLMALSSLPLSHFFAVLCFAYMYSVSCAFRSDLLLRPSFGPNTHKHKTYAAFLHHPLRACYRLSSRHKPRGRSCPLIRSRPQKPLLANQLG